MTTQPTIDVKELKSQIAKGDISLLDVRRKTDYEAEPAKIPGAVWRDPEQVDQWRGELPTDGTTILYCVRGGSVSQSVCKHLGDSGLAVIYLEGGLKAWTDQGEDVE